MDTEYNKMKSENIQENKIFLAIQYLDKSVFQVGFCSALAFWLKCVNTKPYLVET